MHISGFAFFDWMSLAFALGAGFGGWFYQKIFSWKYQQLVNRRARGLDAIAEQLNKAQECLSIAAGLQPVERCTNCGKPLELTSPHTLECKPCDRYWSTSFPPSRLKGDPDEQAIMAVRTSVDAIEAALAACKHPYHADGYCITCGARNFGGTWAAPHWRDLLVDAHVFVVGDLGILRGKGRLPHA